MKIIGIIIEANPLHHGHEHLINTVKQEHNPDCLIAVVSTYFTMRGDINCVTKKEKINQLLNSGFDLVFELPIALSMHRSDIFAENSVKILKTIGITHLAFGSEIQNIDLFNRLLAVRELPEYQELFKYYLNTNSSYKQASIKALSHYFDPNLISVFSHPNFTLGLEYLKYLKDTNIEPIIIKRIGSYNETNPTSSITSATAVRTLITNNQDISKYVSFNNYLNLSVINKNIFELIKYKLLVETKSLNTDVEGIGNYIRNHGDFNTDYNDFVNKLANKKYTKTRIRRYLINLLINNRLPYIIEENYLRLIGFNKTGINYINSLDTSIKEQIFNTPKNLKNEEVRKYLDLEIKTAKLFSLISNTDIEEFKLPVRKD